MNNLNSVKERIKFFLKGENRSIRDFEINIGASNGFVNSIRQSISPTKIEKITKLYPNLNIVWLLTGEGEMLKSSSSSTTINGSQNNIASNNSTIVSGNSNNIATNKGVNDDDFKKLDNKVNLILDRLETEDGSKLEIIKKMQEQQDKLLKIIEGVISVK